LDAIGPIYQAFIDHDCKIMIATASSIWASQPNSDGALLAGSVLAKIDPDSQCYNDAQGIISKMSLKVLKDEKRDWNLMMKTLDNEFTLEKMQIRAFRDVGVAWGLNQQPTYNDIMWVFR